MTKGIVGMKTLIFTRCPSKLYLFGLACWCLLGFALPVPAQSITWQVLPFPVNTDWPGPQGQASVVNGTELTIQGSPVRTTQSFMPGETISFDVVLDARAAPDGGLQVYLGQAGVAANLIPYPFTLFYMTYRNYEPDALFIEQDSAPHVGSMVWGEVPFTFAAQTTYHVTIGVAANGQVSWTINGQAYSIPNTVLVPLTPFQIELWGWQPTNVYQINNFTVTPISSCPNIIGTWSGQVNVANPLSGYSKMTLSLNITDQNTNGCLLRGNLNTGIGRDRSPWGWFNTGGALGNIPFTGTTPDAADIVLNLGIFGQASATLDMSQTPPVMKKFILLPSAGVASGSTVVGDLTQVPSSP
jgi:hypothetical protein